MRRADLQIGGAGLRLPAAQWLPQCQQPNDSANAHAAQSQRLNTTEQQWQPTQQQFIEQLFQQFPIQQFQLLFQ